MMVDSMVVLSDSVIGDGYHLNSDSMMATAMQITIPFDELLVVSALLAGYMDCAIHARRGRK